METKEFILPYFKTGKALDADLATLGFNLAFDEWPMDPDIEKTLIACSYEAIYFDNARNGGLLVDWITAHHSKLNVDRLIKLITQLHEEPLFWVKAFWCANAQRLEKKDTRFRRLADFYRGQEFDFVERKKVPTDFGITDMYIRLHGEDERFIGTCFRLSKNIFRNRPRDIRPVRAIQKRHKGFRFRTMFGPNYRADVWALLYRDPTLTGYRLAKIALCSEPSALSIKKDYEDVKRDYSNRKTNAA